MSAGTGGLDVAGGSHGLAVSLDEMAWAARRLDRVADQLQGLLAELLLLEVHPRLQAASLVAPDRGLPLQLGLARLCSPVGIGGSALALEVLADGVAEALAVYDDVERLVDGAIDTVEVGVGIGLGATAPLTVPALGLGVAVASPERVDAWLFDHPWVVPHTMDGLEGVVLGLGLGVPVAGPWLLGRSLGAGGYPPRSQPEAVEALLLGLAGTGLMDESGHRASVVPGARQPGRGPRSVADLVARDGPSAGGQKVRVTRVARPDGTSAWIVDVPGTQTFDPRTGRTIYDMTSNARLAANQRTLSTQAIADALGDAQARMGGPGARHEPILLNGHSQGGLTAAALAADPRVRRRFPGARHVVTTGAPVATVPVGRDVSVLSVEHDQDLVPGLDGADNPDREQWVTVRRDVAEDLDEDAGATEAHDNDLYERTAAQIDDAGDQDPSLRDWRAGAAPFLDGGEAETIDYEITRERR
ncbi:hypothetical protein GCM10027055_04740 [Janibacter alkaliphilus]|uniref:PGAP1-like protein n=1 Tax=Janibacter alkaliphilus TaxID=1069963 RepID=A0A852X3T2_9MICO|nr:hypothetical protein [Janibacter alkaliphilus]NYG37088.1 hypothetical protein [Janibacter alkaliphilus]